MERPTAEVVPEPELVNKTVTRLAVRDGPRRLRAWRTSRRSIELRKAAWEATLAAGPSAVVLRAALKRW
jgi:hypothetical protein